MGGIRTQSTIAVALLFSLSAVAACGGGPGGAAGRGEKNISIAFSSATPQVEKVPTILAANKFKTDGREVKLTYLKSSEDPVQAVVRGEAVFGSAATSAVFAAINERVPVTAVMSASGPSYAMVAPKKVTDPSGLDGLRVGIHAKVSSTALYTKLITTKYKVRPKIVVVPGSANRLSSLAEGQLDASLIQLSDLPRLEKLAPGRFHVIYNFAEKYKSLLDAVIFVKESTAENNPELVREVLAEILKQQQAAYDDPAALADAIVEYVPDVSAKTAADLAKTYTGSEVWPRDGGFSKMDIQRTLEAMQTGRLLETVPTVHECCDRSLLDGVSPKPRTDDQRS